MFFVCGVIASLGVFAHNLETGEYAVAFGFPLAVAVAFVASLVELRTKEPAMPKEAR